MSTKSKAIMPDTGYPDGADLQSVITKYLYEVAN